MEINKNSDYKKMRNYFLGSGMQNRITKACAGFTLIELIVAIFVLASVAAVAIPSYVHYVQKAYYSEVVQTAYRYRLAVTVCLRLNKGDKSRCDSGKSGIPPNIEPGMGMGQVDTLTVNDGVITVIPKDSNGITAKDSYILTPVIRNNNIYWKKSGGGCKRHLATSCR